MSSVPVGKVVKARSTQQVERQRGVSPLTRVVIMLLLPVIVGALIACDNGSGGTQQGQGSSATSAARAPYEGVPEGKPKGLNGSVPNPKEVLETKPVGQIPDFLNNVLGSNKEAVKTLYQGAAAHYDEFGYIPCYCGCAIYEHPHHDLSECFIKSMSDTSVEFTDHSTTCSQCQEAAQMTIDGLAQGTPLKDIRAAVFKKLNYTQIWTDTPAP